MAELRSFIIGVTIAAVLLGLGAVAFGAFGGGNGDSPSAVLLGTPPATRTQQPAVTRTALPTQPAGAATNAANPQKSPTTLATSSPPPGSATQAPTATKAAASPTTAAPTAAPPTATRAVQPTAVPATATPVPPSPKTAYVNAVNPPLTSFSAQMNYLLGNISSPNISDTSWKQYTVQAAQSVQSLAAQVAGVSAPGCLSSAAGSLDQGVNAASAAAGQVIAAVNAGDTGALGSASSALSSAAASVNSGISAVQNASC